MGNTSNTSFIILSANNRADHLYSRFLANLSYVDFAQIHLKGKKFHIRILPQLRYRLHADYVCFFVGRLTIVANAIIIESLILVFYCCCFRLIWDKKRVLKPLFLITRNTFLFTWLNICGLQLNIRRKIEIK